MPEHICTSASNKRIFVFPQKDCLVSTLRLLCKKYPRRAPAVLLYGNSTRCKLQLSPGSVNDLGAGAVNIAGSCDGYAAKLSEWGDQ